MRKSLERLEHEIIYIDVDNLYQAIGELKAAMCKILELLDEALPLEVEPD